MVNLSPGTIVGGRYRLDAELGRGGFGSVHRAVDERNGAVVTLKFLQDRREHRRFRVEARALTTLDHPNCLKILDVGLHDELPYIVAEHLEGPTLRDWLAAPRTIADRLVVALNLTEALAHAHRRGVLHRDFKPDNIIVRTSPNVSACVLDFGLAKLSGAHQPDITKTGEVLGTPGFMSPEQLMGTRDVGPESDMYCLGVVLYEMFEGSPPFGGRSAFDICLQHLNEDPPTMRSVEPALARLVARLMDKKPSRRPSSAHVVRELRKLLGMDVSASDRIPAFDRRAVTSVAIAALVVIVGAIALLVSVMPEDERAAPVQTRHTDLIRAAPSEPALPAHEPDVGAEAVLGPGCGEPLPSGRVRLNATIGLQRRSVDGVVPKTYDPQTAHPLVIALHEGNATPDDTLRELDLVGLADRLGAVVVVPNGKIPFSGSWRVDADVIIAQARDVADHAACIDPDRVILLGHGVGGRGALIASCAAPYAALIVTNRKLDIGEVPCETRFPLPTMWIMVSPYELPDGCGPPIEQMSPEDHLKLFQGRQQCSDKRTRRTPAHGVCDDWQCETPLTFCSVAGGVHWREGFGTPCDGPATPFDHHAEIERFLDQHL